MEVSGRSYEANPGDAVLFYPNMPYSAYTGSNDCRFIYIHFDFTIGNNVSILEYFNFSGIISGSTIKDEACLFIRACEKYERKADMSAMLIKGSLIILLSAIINSCTTRKPKTVS